MIPKLAAGTVLLLALVGAVAAGAPSDPAAPAGTTADDGAAAGTIEGVVRMEQKPPRRTVSRYPGAGPAAARPIQRVPAVVYLEGGIGDAPAPSSSVSMAQADTSFAPPLLVVPVGTTVDFPNQDPFFHNVFSYSGPGRFDLGRYPRGESKSVTFSQPGQVKVYCEVHESMRAAILVVENRYWAEPDEQGRFRIEGVPAGTYTLVAWHVDRREQKREVTVPSTGSVRVEIDL